MTKAELLKKLEPFEDDIEVTIDGMEMRVWYRKAGEYPAGIELMDECRYCCSIDKCEEL